MNRTPHIVVVARSTASAEQLARRVERAGFVVAARHDVTTLAADDGWGERLFVVDGAGATADAVLRHARGARIIVVGSGASWSKGGGSAIAGAVASDADDVVLGAAIRAVSVGLRVTSAAVRPPIEDAYPDDELGDSALAESLTERERDVLELVAHGLSNHEIASRLRISNHTVKFHLASVFGKLDVSTRTAAVRCGLARGLITI